VREIHQHHCASLDGQRANCCNFSGLTRCDTESADGSVDGAGALFGFVATSLSLLGATLGATSIIIVIIIVIIIIIIIIIVIAVIIVITIIIA